MAAMTKLPEVAKKAQIEIDLVIDEDRLPSFEDRDKLPYLDCVLKECLRQVTFSFSYENSLLAHKKDWRWRPPFPLGEYIFCLL